MVLLFPLNESPNDVKARITFPSKSLTTTVFEFLTFSAVNGLPAVSVATKFE